MVSSLFCDPATALHSPAVPPAATVESLRSAVVLDVHARAARIRSRLRIRSTGPGSTPRTPCRGGVRLGEQGYRRSASRPPPRYVRRRLPFSFPHPPPRPPHFPPPPPPPP